MSTLIDQQNVKPCLPEHVNVLRGGEQGNRIAVYDDHPALASRKQFQNIPVELQPISGSDLNLSFGQPFELVAGKYPGSFQILVNALVRLQPHLGDLAHRKPRQAAYECQYNQHEKQNNDRKYHVAGFLLASLSVKLSYVSIVSPKSWKENRHTENLPRPFDEPIPI